MNSGDHFIAAKQLYGGSTNQFSHAFKKFSWQVSFVDHDDFNGFKSAITPKTKAIFIESLANPSGIFTDIEKIAAIAHEAGIPLIVDNTMASPYLVRPIEWGADIVVHSLTKFIGGHGNSIGGIIVDSGKFPWAQGNFPMLNDPSPAYHGMKIGETFGSIAYIIKARVEGLRDVGTCLSPFNAFLFLQGIETLGLRMDRHLANALKVAEFLQAHGRVDWVAYPTLPGNKYNALAKKYMPKGAGAVFSFGIKGGQEAGKKFINSVKLFSHLANVGDARSLVINPASTTHQQLSPEQQKAAGVMPEMVRLSIGLEDIDDLLWDLDQALGQSA